MVRNPLTKHNGYQHSVTVNQAAYNSNWKLFTLSD